MTIYNLSEISIENLCKRLKPHSVIKVRSCVECKTPECGCLEYVYITVVKELCINGLIMAKSPINNKHLVFTNITCHINNDNRSGKDKIYIMKNSNSNFSTGWCLSFIESLPVTIDTIVI